MKNKEIEELLNNIKFEYNNKEKWITDMALSADAWSLLLSYIEQLETDYKEANESVTWWQNRYDAIVKQNDDNHKKVVKLENNRDKAIEYIEKDLQISILPNNQIINGTEVVKRINKIEDILKGGSDE